MKKSVPITRFNRAAFRVHVEEARSGRVELLLEEILTQVFAGDGTTCTAFTCSVYAPPPAQG
jgi:hypothetical protein